MKDIRVGIYCIALYEDELYYRAKLVSFKDNFHVEVSVFQGLFLRAGGWGLGAGVLPPANMSMITGLAIPYETFGDHSLITIFH